MVIRLALASVALGALMGYGSPTYAAPTGATNKQGAAAHKQGVIDARAAQILRRMSDYLGSLGSFRVDAKTVDEMVTKDGQKIQEVKQSQITLRRPNELRVDRVGPAGHGTFQYDGKQFAVSNVDKKIYATAPAPPTLPAAIDTAREQLKVDAPGAELLVPNSYESLTDGIITGRYIGLEPIGGVMAHHLAATKEDVDWEIWIQDGPQPVPVRFVITTKTMTSRPQYTLELRNWQPNMGATAAMFRFTPPAGSRRVQFSASAKTQPPG